jgi:hypothetical protein
MYDIVIVTEYAVIIVTQCCIYCIYSRNLRTFFSSLAAEKSECVKYADFPAFEPRNALLSLFAFFNNYFCFLE